MVWMHAARALFPALRRLDPEIAHTIALRALAAGMVPGQRGVSDSRLAVSVGGLRFANPIGLAAGFDKDAVAIRQLARLGFGFVEAGTVTPLPQPGNPKPRLFRLREDDAVINRMGFNNAGIEAFRTGLQSFSARALPVGANLGLNKSGAEPLRDYPALIERVRDVADYVTINVSSPNTPGLRDLQAPDRLASILDAIAAELGNPPPLFIKLAPDLSPEALESVTECACNKGVCGLILTNTTIARPASLRSRYRHETGGLSGRPLFSLSIECLRRAARVARGRLTLIGCGGIFSGEDILAKIEAGASLVQVYTAFVLEGPAFLPRIQRELLAALERRGYASLGQAVGAAL